MAGPTFTMIPTRGASSAGVGAAGSTTPAAARRSACPLASSCSCAIFPKAGSLPVDEGAAPALHTEVTHWTDLGYAVVRSDAATVVLERRRLTGFCVNLALTVLTGLLWLAYWIPNIVRPRFDVVTLTVTPGGDVATATELVRR